MGTLYEAKCRSCHYEFELVAGNTMVAWRRVCDSCGKTIALPSQAPKDSYELSQAGIRQFIRSDEFPLHGRLFTESEHADLLKLTATCECGGHMVTDDGEGSVKYRCPKCKSTNLHLEDVADVD